MLEVILSEKIIQPIIIIIVSSLLTFIINKIIKKLMKVKLNHLDARRNKTIMGLINNLIKYFILIVAVLMILNIYGINTTALVTSLGVVGLVAGLAVQDSLKDFVSGITIIIENQYAVGDTVTINGLKGEVIGLGMKTTKLKTAIGDTCFIANRNIVDVINHSMNNSLAVVLVQVAYEDDIDKAEQILENLCQLLSKELPYLKGEVTLLGVEDLAASGIEFKITVETNPLKQYEVQRMIRKRIKQELDKNNITIPYNQVVIHNA